MIIEILRGIKGSGKTKYAMQRIESLDGCDSWRVSKSDIRTMLYGKNYYSNREAHVKEVFWDIVESLIVNGNKNTVIYLDNLNIRDLSESIDKIKDMFDSFDDVDMDCDIKVITFRPTLRQATDLAEKESPEAYNIATVVSKQYEMAKAFGIYDNSHTGVRVSYEDRR